MEAVRGMVWIFSGIAHLNSGLPRTNPASRKPRCVTVKIKFRLKFFNLGFNSQFPLSPSPKADFTLCCSEYQGLSQNLIFFLQF